LQIEAKNGAKSEFHWMDMQRGMAVIAIVIHHWLRFMPYGHSKLSDLICTITGTFVHLFFVLSGCGLTVSYYREADFSWKEWARRRFVRLVAPYWIIITATFALANGLSAVPGFNPKTYSWDVLLSYFTFSRNFFSAGWDLNKTFWFIPVILGLYLLFPILLKILQKWGLFALLAISILTTYCSIFLFPELANHEADLPLFHVASFSLGMVVGHLLTFNPRTLRKLADIKMFCLGIFFYGIAWAFGKYLTYGSSYNDFFIAAGIYLISLYFCQVITKFSLNIPVRYLTQFSTESYMMYLIHYPLIAFVMSPIFANFWTIAANSLSMVFLGVIYSFVILILAKLFSPMINSLTLFPARLKT
jgi:peptidoglycan/LPS O-acetylase OafA/YrhL